MSESGSAKFEAAATRLHGLRALELAGGRDALDAAWSRTSYRTMTAHNRIDNSVRDLAVNVKPIGGGSWRS